MFQITSVTDIDSFAVKNANVCQQIGHLKEEYPEQLPSACFLILGLQHVVLVFASRFAGPSTEWAAG